MPGYMFLDDITLLVISDNEGNPEALVCSTEILETFFEAEDSTRHSLIRKIRSELSRGSTETRDRLVEEVGAIAFDGISQILNREITDEEASDLGFTEEESTLDRNLWPGDILVLEPRALRFAIQATSGDKVETIAVYSCEDKALRACLGLWREQASRLRLIWGTDSSPAQPIVDYEVVAT